MIAVLGWMRDHIGLAVHKFNIATSEDSDGKVPSSGRYVALALVLLAGVMTFTVREYMLRAGRPDAAVVGSAAAVVTALITGLAYVYKSRSNQ